MEAASLLDLGAGDFMKLIMSYILAANVVFIPALILIGMFLKSIEKIDNQHIRIFLAILGIIFILLKDGLGIDPVLQGIYVAGASVLLYDIKHSVFSKKEVIKYVNLTESEINK